MTSPCGTRLACPGSLASVVVNYAGSELARNDPEFAVRSTGIDTSDYFLRHPEWTPGSASLVVNYAGSALASNDPEFARSRHRHQDYFLRHPELTGIDTSDYFLRHPELLSK